MTKQDTPHGNPVDLGPLSTDLLFQVRTLQSLLRPEVQGVRDALSTEPGSIGVLSIIALNPGISQNDLARSVVLKKSAVTALVKTLEADGLLERRRLDEDRRMNALTLTDAGSALIEQSREATGQLARRLFTDIDPADRAAFFRVMNALVAVLQDQTTPGS